MKQSLWLGWALFLFLICTGCGSYFRPVIIPNPPAFPDPRASHTAVAISNNGAIEGSAMVINVTGDSKVSVADCSGGSPCLGIAPVHAVQQTATQVLVVNQAAPGELGDSLSKVTFSGTVIAVVTTITLPPDSAPNFVAVAPSSTTAYVTLPNYVPDPVNNPGVVVPSIGVVNTSSSQLGPTIPVGDNPIAVAVTPDKNKLYVANNGSNSVSTFNTVDRSPRNNPAIALNAPLWIVPRSDSQRVYVLEGNGAVATLDTTATSGPDTVIDASLSVPGASYMLYDSLKNRLYIPANDPQTGTPALTVVSVGSSTPLVLARVPLPAPGVAVTALPDGSRAYAASNGDSQITTIGVISNVTGDGNHATYTYDAASLTGPAPQAGMSLAISGGGDAFDGTYIVTSASGNTFAVRNSLSSSSTTARTATGTNFLPQVTVINTSSNTVKTTISLPAVPADGPYDGAVCASTRFRFMMAAGGDSSRVYLASCDSGSVHIIDTSNDSYIAPLPAPPSARAPIPPSTQPPPQSPVFLIAGP